jgi:ABC-type lipoprotein export system ATPase subunit
MIEIIALKKGFREGKKQRVIFDGLSLEIGTKEFVSIQGPSGSGKSTLLNLLAGIEQPDAGEVLFRGNSVSSLSDSDAATFRKKEIGFIFQSYNLIPYLSVLDNICLPLELNQLPMEQEKIFALMKELGIEELKDQFPDTLSGGEQQRTAIARALAHKPSLVLADEPTGNLDEPAAVNVLEILRSLPEQTGCTIVMVTHSELASSYADRVLHFSHHQLFSDSTEAI